MSALHQYLLDSYRAEQRGDRLPPLPGTQDVATLRAVRDHRRFRAVVAGRPARGRLRTALDRRLRSRAC
ncbi:hypothetical protein [Streptomyces vilmorinianum]|uniref:hypothetical protein n=1 Tax=Streptomyces vilmorinianum TaxID=3051092 RepID=UPI0010FB54CA|nr:hypothetical protein [Streptomyces vilmorinianum]